MKIHVIRESIYSSHCRIWVGPLQSFNENETFQQNLTRLKYACVAFISKDSPKQLKQFQINIFSKLKIKLHNILPVLKAATDELRGLFCFVLFLSLSFTFPFHGQLHFKKFLLLLTFCCISSQVYLPRKVWLVSFLFLL